MLLCTNLCEFHNCVTQTIYLNKIQIFNISYSLMENDKKIFFFSTDETMFHNLFYFKFYAVLENNI